MLCGYLSIKSSLGITLNVLGYYLVSVKGAEMKFARQQLKQSKQNILPLMDCMFILLIYFIFTMMMMVMAETLPIKLPKLDKTPDDKLTYYSVIVQPQGKILWNKSTTPISIDQLKFEIQKLLEKGYTPKVFLETAYSTDFGYFVDVLDLLRELNILQISIETDIDKKK